jgi:hypothetical protein
MCAACSEVRRARARAAAEPGFSRIVASEIEAPNVFAIISGITWMGGGTHKATLRPSPTLSAAWRAARVAGGLPRRERLRGRLRGGLDARGVRARRRPERRLRGPGLAALALALRAVARCPPRGRGSFAALFPPCASKRPAGAELSCSASPRACARAPRVRKTPSWPRRKLQPFLPVFLEEVMGQPASSGPT